MNSTRLIRLYMSLLVGLTAVAGLGLAGGLLPVGISWLAFGAQFCIAASGFALNDVLDRERDKNVRVKPLASGAIGLKVAWGLVIGFLVLGLVTSSLLSWAAMLLAVGQLLTIAVYSKAKSLSGILANGITAGLCASGYLFGSLAIGTLGNAWIPALLTAELILVREVMKDVIDMAPDSKAHIPTVPLIRGLNTTRVLVAIGILLETLTLLLPPIREALGSQVPGLLIISLGLALGYAPFALRPIRRNAGVFLHVSAVGFALALTLFIVG